MYSLSEDPPLHNSPQGIPRAGMFYEIPEQCFCDFLLFHLVGEVHPLPRAYKKDTKKSDAAFADFPGRSKIKRANRGHLAEITRRDLQRYSLAGPDPLRGGCG